MVISLHKINLNQKQLRTDLIMEQNLRQKKEKTITKNQTIEVTETSIGENDYTTINFKDITDKGNFKKVQESFVNELKKYLKLTKKDRIIIIGLGNDKCTPDSLGPLTIENILVTRHLFLLGEVEEGYSNVSSFIPNVMGNTGIETSEIIKCIVKEIKPTKVVVIDSLKTNNIERLAKTIQITNQGISPGSGIGNKRKEISKKTINAEVIAIGIPLVVDISSLANKINKEMIVTPTNIDLLVEKLSLLIGNGINISLHENFIRQNNCK